MTVQKFKISGRWSQHQVINSVQSAQSIPADLHARANALFQQFQASRPGAYDGHLVGLQQLQTDRDQLTICGAPVLFSEYLATRDPHHSPEWPRANPIGTTSMLMTSDGDILVSVRSLQVEQNPGGLYFVGGFTEFAADGSFDLFANAEREVEEETGLKLPQAIADTTLIGIDYDDIFPHPEAFFLVQLTLSSAELAAHLRHHKHEEAEKFELLSQADFFAIQPADRLLTWSFQTGRQLLAEHI